MRKVRTTFNPDQEIEVDEREYTDLSRQGLLVENEKADGKTHHTHEHGKHGSTNEEGR